MSHTITSVPLLDLSAEYHPYKDEILSVVSDIIDANQYILGGRVQTFEANAGEYCQSKHAVGVSSGTDALLLALMAIGVEAGDEVITSPFTFFATGGSIARSGAKPVFVDINPNTFNIDPSLIESAITDKTKAIMPVHLFGQTADMTAIMAIAEKHNLVVIEDAAQSIGAEHKGVRAGALGHIGCFSFFPTKNLGACGDAGLVTCQDDKLGHQINIMRVHGGERRYYHDVVGGNFRIDAIQAAILDIKLPHLDKSHKARQENATFYYQELGSVDGIQLPLIEEANTSIYNQFSVLVDNRESFTKHLDAQKIGYGIYYPLPLHLQNCFAYLGYKKGDFPHSERVADQILSLPIYAGLSEAELGYITSSIKDYFSA